MESRVETTHRVTITQADFMKWVAAKAADIPLKTARIFPPLENDGRALTLTFAVDAPYLDAFLHTVIPGLPAAGGYTYEILTSNPSVVAKVTWSTQVDS